MIRRAREHDAEALVQLINHAFLVERFFPTATASMGSRGYFGLLSVAASRQRSGLGKRLATAAEDYRREAGCASMDLQIVDLRTELPPFYQKLGYKEEGTALFLPTCRHGPAGHQRR